MAGCALGRLGFGVCAAVVAGCGVVDGLADVGVYFGGLVFELFHGGCLCPVVIGAGGESGHAASVAAACTGRSIARLGRL